MAGVTTSKKSAYTKTGENLEVKLVSCSATGWWLEGSSTTSWSGDDWPRGVAHREKHPDNGERKADRNRRAIEAFLWPGSRQILGGNDHRKEGESLEMFFATNKHQRKRCERVTVYITRFEEGIKTLQDNAINLLTIDDVPGWMLMRKTSLTQERRERSIAALPVEHFRVNDVKRVLVLLFSELHISEHREFDGQSRRQRTDNTGPSSTYQRRESASYPRRYRSALATGHEWADTESVDEETDVNSADLHGFARSELEAKLENAAMESSAVPEALVTMRAARDKMKGKSEGKGEPTVSFSRQGKGKWRKPSSAKHLQVKLSARKAKSTCHECGQRGHWAGDPGCTGTRDTNFTAWSDEQMLANREDYRATVSVERVEQFDGFPSCFGLREHSVCTTSVTKLHQFPVGEHTRCGK